jgi:hypothetical protein
MVLTVDSTSRRNESRNPTRGKGLPARKADNLTAIYGLYGKCGSLDIAQPYRPPWSVKRDSFARTISQMTDRLVHRQLNEPQ